MTLIEFYDKDAVTNICSSLVAAPERVILVGDKKKTMQRCAERYQAVLAARGVETEFLCRVVNKNQMQSILDVLSSIVLEYEDCVFDLTGGEDLYLAAMGIVCERCRDRDLQLHRFNIRNNTVIDVDQDGKTILTEPAPELTVREMIRIAGGDIVCEEERPGTTHLWEMTPEFREDVNAIWELCRRDMKLWNAQLLVFEAAEQILRDASALTVSVPTAVLRRAVEDRGGSFFLQRELMRGLVDAGLLEHLSCDDELFSVTYKDAQIKRCLTLAGRALEMKVYLAALEAREKDGSAVYSDVMNGVFIDWDGVIHADQGGYDTENEIDVLMMHGLIPVFISCKSGIVDKSELYKLSTVAERFGGKNAKKVLISAALDQSDAAHYLRQRARDMGIRLVEGSGRDGAEKAFAELTDRELNRVLRSLWSG